MRPTRGAGAPPSLRQARWSARSDVRYRQRGAPAPLPHCGTVTLGAIGVGGVATRGAGAPPSLRRISRIPGSRAGPPTRGAGAPPSLRLRLPRFRSANPAQRGAPAPLPHCGDYPEGDAPGMVGPTRGAGAPPSLRLGSAGCAGALRFYNEGRRRPSLIAALDWEVYEREAQRQRGAPAPLPHCGKVKVRVWAVKSMQRGAPAPLPHCGWWLPSVAPNQRDQRGAPAPLPHCGAGSGSNRAADLEATRGAGAPPSLRQPAVAEGGLGGHQRGAPAPLPHCGTSPTPYSTYAARNNEGRRRPSLIAA